MIFKKHFTKVCNRDRHLGEGRSTISFDEDMGWNVVSFIRGLARVLKDTVPE